MEGQKIILPACVGLYFQDTLHHLFFSYQITLGLSIFKLPTQANRQEREEEGWDLFARAGCYLK